MSEIEEGPEPQDEPGVAAEPVVEAPPPVDPETEELARKYGWKPKSESTLPDASYMDADRFVAASKTQVRILRDKLGETDKRAEAAEHMARTAADTVRRQERERFEARLVEVQSLKREAVANADTERFDKLDEIEARVRAQAAAAPEMPADIAAFFADEAHAWTKNPVLKSAMAAAIDADPTIKQLSPIEQLRWADREVRDAFPHKFPKPVEQPRDDTTGRFSRVDGGGLGRVGQHTGLTAAETADYNILQKKGIFKTPAEYIAYSKQLGVRE
jgi:hypothetical protein